MNTTILEKQTPCFPPGPKGWPLIGSLPAFAKDMLGFLEQTARQYGDVSQIMITNVPVYLLNNADDIEYVLTRTNGLEFSKGPVDTVSALLFGNGLLTSRGDFWLRQRRLAQPAFHRQRIAAYGADMVAYSQQTAVHWQSGQIYDIHKEMMALTLRIVAKTLFNAEIQSGPMAQVGKAMEVVMDTFAAMMKNPFMVIPLKIPTPANLRFRRAVQELDSTLEAIIRECRTQNKDSGDLLSMFLQVQDEDGTRMTDQQLRDEMMTMFLAGHETTALALTWTLYLLAQNPSVEAELVAELETVLNGRLPTVADISQLSFTEKVLKEGMRLYPPAWGVDARIADKDSEIHGYTVPKGTAMFISQWVTHRNPRYFAEPERFNPGRWTEAFSKQLPKYAYFPFGGGQRQCIGNNFAMMEASLILATLVQAYHFKLVPGQQIIPQPSITVRPKNGIQMWLVKRE